MCLHHHAAPELAAKSTAKTVSKAPDTVRIGEVDNIVTLKKAEWNVLVEAIQSGQLDRV